MRSRTKTVLWTYVGLPIQFDSSLLESRNFGVVVCKHCLLHLLECRLFVCDHCTLITQRLKLLCPVSCLLGFSCFRCCSCLLSSFKAYGFIGFTQLCCCGSCLGGQCPSEVEWRHTEW